MMVAGIGWEAGWFFFFLKRTRCGTSWIPETAEWKGKQPTHCWSNPTSQYCPLAELLFEMITAWCRAVWHLPAAVTHVLLRVPEKCCSHTELTAKEWQLGKHEDTRPQKNIHLVCMSTYRHLSPQGAIWGATCSSSKFAVSLLSLEDSTKHTGARHQLHCSDGRTWPFSRPQRKGYTLVCPQSSTCDLPREVNSVLEVMNQYSYFIPGATGIRMDSADTGWGTTSYLSTRLSFFINTFSFLSVSSQGGTPDVMLWANRSRKQSTVYPFQALGILTALCFLVKPLCCTFTQCFCSSFTYCSIQYFSYTHSRKLHNGKPGHNAD